MSANKIYDELSNEKLSLFKERESLYKSIEPALKTVASKLEAVDKKLDKLTVALLKEDGLGVFYDVNKARLVYNMGWKGGLGSSAISNAMRKLISEANLYISAYGGGWREDDEGNTVYIWSLQLPKVYELDEEKLARTKDFVEKVFEVNEAIMGAGNYNFSIFEYTLSEHASYSLRKKEEQWMVTTSRYGSLRDQEAMPLEELLQYIATHHWYE